MVKDLLHIALTGMALIASGSMSAQAIYRSTQDAGKASVMAKQGASRQLLTRQQAFNNKTVTTPSFGTRADAMSMEWGYCSEPYSSLPIDGEIKVAVRMTKEIAETYVGNTITAINIANPVDANTVIGGYDYANPVKEATVWISESRDGEPLVTGTGTLGELGFYWSTIKLDQPFEITEAKNLFIGVTLNVPEGMFGYVADGVYPENNYSAFLYSAYNLSAEGEIVNEGSPKWRAVGTWLGNACIRAVIEGENLPQNNVSIEEYSLPSVVTPGEEFPVQLAIINRAANEVSKVTVSMQIGDAEPQTRECEIAVGYDANGEYVMGPLAYNQYGIIETSFKCDQIGNNIPWTLTISKINGDADNNSGEKLEDTLLSIKEGFAKTNVIEEATGTWCGYCVMGYAGMEWLSENAPNFIGAAIHQGDPMTVLDDGGAYSPFAQLIDGFPSAFLNRNWKTVLYPSPDEFEVSTEEYGSIPAMAEIEAKIVNADETGSKVRLSTTSRFSLAESDVEYAIGYTVIEDNVGPYYQTNYLSGSSDYAYGFESMPNPVELIYDEVARNCSHPTAVEGSTLTTTEIGKDYEFTTEINLSDVEDLTKYHVIAYVLNCKNGAIENACEVLSPTYSGVKKIESESKSAPIAYGGKGFINILSAGDNISILALDGHTAARKVSNGKVSMAPGIYIVTDGRKSAKVIVR